VPGTAARKSSSAEFQHSSIVDPVVVRWESQLPQVHCLKFGQPPPAACVCFTRPSHGAGRQPIMKHKDAQ
jgi:hypothetical protein